MRRGITNLRSISVGLKRAHYDGRKQGFFIGILTMGVYFMLSGVVGYWALLVMVVAGAVVQGRRPS